MAVFQFPVRLCVGVMATLVCLTSPGYGDIIIDGYTAATNDRFSNNGGFIGSAFSFSGVGQTTGGTWATAISSNVVISAAHAAPVGNVYFYQDNNPTNPVIRSIESGQTIPGTDLYLARLSNPLPGTIQTYSFATEFLTAPTAGPYQDMVAYMLGRTPEGSPLNQSQAVGRNKISGYFASVNVGGQGTVADVLFLNRDLTGSADFVQYEAHLQPGDSGAPLFADMGGQLRLLGTNLGISETLSAVNYTGNQSAFINNFIGLNAVPEPSSILLVGMVGWAALGWRRRQESLAA